MPRKKDAQAPWQRQAWLRREREGRTNQTLNTLRFLVDPKTVKQEGGRRIGEVSASGGSLNRTVADYLGTSPAPVEKSIGRLKKVGLVQQPKRHPGRASPLRRVVMDGQYKEPDQLPGKRKKD